MFVNRGFLPTEIRDPATRPGGQPEGEAIVTGILRAPEERGWFVPQNAPDHNRSSREIRPHAAAKGLAAPRLSMSTPTRR